MSVPELIHDALRFWARRWPDKPAVHSDTTVLSYGQLDAGSDELAAGMLAAGVGRGDTVGILMPNRVEFVEVMLAAFKIGAAVTPLNVRYTATEMLHPVTDSAARLIVADARLLPALERVERERTDLRVYVVGEAVGERPSLDELRRPGELVAAEVADDDVALICYTSGTTGMAKGALLTHRNLYAASTAKSFALGQSYDDRVLVPMPLAYTGGCVAVIRDGVIPGATIYVVTVSDAGTFLHLIEHERITSMVGVTILWEQMLHHPDFATTDLSTLRIASTGGSAVSEPLLQGWYRRGVSITQGYGLTEVSGSYVTYLFAEEARDHIGSVGRAMLHMQVRLVDDHGDDVPDGTPGEFVVRGPTVTKGYLNRPDGANDAEGWLHTGDVGVRDPDGFYRIIDRVKDMLISGGLNVYPAEIELTLAKVPGLHDFSVIGVADERWGEVPALVSADPSTIDLAALQAVCETELADYKRPKYVIGHGGPLPRTLSGKIQKPQLRRLYRAVPDDAVPLGKRTTPL